MSKLSASIVAILLFTSTAAVAVDPDYVGKTHQWVMDRTEAGGTVDILVQLRERPDLGTAKVLKTKQERGWFVYDSLFETAERSQFKLRALLDQRDIPYRPFYINNSILIEGVDRAFIEELALREEVLRIDGNPTFKVDLERPTTKGGPNSFEAIEWGVSRINAPQVWAMGFRGAGIVAAGQDTGYRWTHETIQNQYRGWDGFTANHDYNWHDSIHAPATGGVCGADSVVPCDDNGHGTHTMGTIVGDDGGANQVGVAPEAKWIGCRNMDQGNGTPARYLECFEFFLAPYPVGSTPASGDPAQAPDVTNNSWGCPASEGCSWNSFLSAVAAQRAAGIMTVVSAGNAGSACNTVDDPAAIYDDSYTVGSTTNTNAMSGFSSRGVADDTGLPKPDIVAPGSSIRAGNRGADNQYQTISGTSMAGPHVAGAVALFWSARPSFKNDQTATENAFNASATRLTAIVEGCGGDYVNGPNNTWGHGLINVELAVVNAVPWAQYQPGSAVQTLDCGDDDGFPDNSETIDVDFVIENAGPGDLNNVTVVSITSTHPGVTGITLPAPVPTIANGGQEVVSFSYDLSGATAGQSLDFTVEVTATEMTGNSTGNFSFTAEQDLVLTPNLVWDFEAGMDGWTLTQGTFAPSGVYGGANGTSALASSANLDNQCDQVRSPAFTLSGTSTLTVATHYDIEENGGGWWDQANVAIYDVGSDVRTAIDPTTGRTYNADGANASCGSAGENGWADRTFQSWADSGGFNLAPFVGQLVRLDVLYGTDGAVNGNGFRIDHVRLTDVESIVPDAQSDTAACCTPPAAPTQLTIGETPPNQVDISWNTVGGADSYNVYRADGSCPGSGYVQVTAGETGTSWADTTVSGGATYAYVVTAFDSALSCESADSNCESITATGSCLSGPSFGGLGTATDAAAAMCQIDLAWSAATSGCGTGVTYDVFRSTTPGFTPMVSNRIASGLTATSYSDSAGLVDSTMYYYIVQAVDVDSLMSDGNALEQSVAATGPSVVAYAEDFDSGPSSWAHFGGSGTTGQFVINTPTLQTDTVVTQPGGDHTTGSGLCFFTATNTSPGANDVDGGDVDGRSGTIDLSAFAGTTSATLNFWYFHGQRDGGDDAGDFFRIDLSNDNGGSWPVTVVSIGDTTTPAVWTEVNFDLDAAITLTNQMMIRVHTADGTGGGDLIEGGIDDIQIVISSSCSTGAASAPAPAPDGQAATTPLTATESGAAVDVAWDASCAATNYVLYYGAIGSGAFTTVLGSGSCALGTAGTASSIPMADDMWWVIDGTDASSRISTHGDAFDGAVWIPRIFTGWSGACAGLTIKDMGATCP